MNNDFKTVSVIIDSNNTNNYFCHEKDSLIKFTVPVAVMHNYVEFPSNMIYETLLKNGEEVQMVKKELENGKHFFYYPDHSYYTLKSHATENIAVCTNEVQTISLNSLIEEACKSFSSMPEEKRDNVTIALSENDQAKKYTMLMKILHNPSYEQESQNLEYKSSFIHPACTKNIIKNESTVQLQVIIKEIVGMANSGQEGTVIVGMTDDGQVCGIEKEFKEFNIGFNKEKFEAMFINLLKQQTCNAVFVNTLNIKWVGLDGHLICKINIPAWKNGIILFSGEQLYVRKQTCNLHLTSEEHISFIKSYNTKIA